MLRVADEVDARAGVDVDADVGRRRQALEIWSDGSVDVIGADLDESPALDVIGTDGPLDEGNALAVTHLRWGSGARDNLAPAGFRPPPWRREAPTTTTLGAARRGVMGAARPVPRSPVPPSQRSTVFSSWYEAEPAPDRRHVELGR